MSSDDYMRKWLRSFSEPWIRRHPRVPKYNLIRDGLESYMKSCLRPVKKQHRDGQKRWSVKRDSALKDRPEFDSDLGTENLDIYCKRACLKASPSVVFLVSYSGEEAINQRSGFIIESVNTYSIVLTTASLVICSTSGNENVETDVKVIVHLSNGRSFDGQIEAYDLHLNVAAVKFWSDTPLPVASLTRLSDHISLDPSRHFTEEELLQHRPNSWSFNLIPGETIIALGRSFSEPIFAVPGVYSIDCCDDDDCKELLMASCNIPSCCYGAPLINRSGEVIGICLRADFCLHAARATTAFLPINIASLWWEHYKNYRQKCLSSLGMEVTNLYAAPLELLETLIQKFTDAFKGVFVELVVPGSSAEAAGIKSEDVIIQLCGRRIRGVLELYENMWNELGGSVELVVIRASDEAPLHLSMVLDDDLSE